MDKFEEHIRKIKRDLDIYDPDPDLWKRIKRELKKGRSITLEWISIAAMVIIVLGTAVVLFKPSIRPERNDYRISNSSGLNPDNSLLGETEIYYNNLVNSLYNKATPLLTNNPEIEKGLSDDLTRLDSICSEIKKDLKDNVANQEVLEALIQNYRIKIRLLEDILTVLKENEGNSGKTNKYEL
jgi:hypothetical protein